jgi:hypothetical protein
VGDIISLHQPLDERRLHEALGAIFLNRSLMFSHISWHNPKNDKADNSRKSLFIKILGS